MTESQTTPVPPLVFESAESHLGDLVRLIGEFAKGNNTDSWCRLWQAREHADLFLGNEARIK